MTTYSKSPKGSILVVDDQSLLCETLERFLSMKGYHVRTSSSAAEALAVSSQQPFDLIVSDVRMPEQSGIDLLEQIKARGTNEDVLLMTGYASIEEGVDVMRRGAADYLVKPFQLDEIAASIDRVLLRRNETAKRRTVNERSVSAVASGRAPRSSYKSLQSLPLVGRSAVMRHLFDIISRIAPTDSSVLITGKTGVGKEVIARAIHDRSPRRNGPFVDINCSAIPETLIEAELFGHQRGTFTGAHETRRGLFEEAEGGTLFLDEINALHPSAQAKLLRVIQERRFRRVGGRENISVDVRIIAAANRDLHGAVDEGSFRADLFFRLSVVPIFVPELCEREEDVPDLANYLLKRQTDRRGLSVRSFSPEAMVAIKAYRWPGNVRELENAIEYALVIGSDDAIGVNDLPPDVIKGGAGIANKTEKLLSSNLTLAEVERLYTLATLKRFNGHHIRTASALGIDRRTLYRKLQQYAIDHSNGNGQGMI